VRESSQQQIGFARIDGDEFGQRKVRRDPQGVRFFPARDLEEKSRQMMDRAVFVCDRFAWPQGRAVFGGKRQPIDGA